MPDLDDFDPPETSVTGAFRFIRNGFMQNDLDANFHQIQNLDTSNLTFTGIASQPPVAHYWFNSFDGTTQTFGIARPKFGDLLDYPTLNQQRAITELGTIRFGQWLATEIAPTKVPKLDGIRAPTGNVFFNDKKITGLGDPVDDQDGVNLRILRQVSGANPKPAVVAATTHSVRLANLTFPVDGVTLVVGDRVLVKNQQDGDEGTGDGYAGPDVNRAYQNGIYIAAVDFWTRATDFDGLPVTSPPGTEVEEATVFVLGGDTQIGTKWIQTEVPPLNVGVDPINFALLERGITIDVGAGLNRIGNTIFAVGTTNRIDIGVGIDISSSYVGQASLTTLGTITTGVWHGSVISSVYGGTGIDNGGNTLTVSGPFTMENMGLAVPGDPLTFRIIGPTTLQLPDVGILATLAGNETFTNKHISAGQIDSGILAIARGGTNAATAAAAINNLLPAQAGHANQVLKTDGVNPYWADA